MGNNDSKELVKIQEVAAEQNSFKENQRAFQAAQALAYRDLRDQARENLQYVQGSITNLQQNYERGLSELRQNDLAISNGMQRGFSDIREQGAIVSTKLNSVDSTLNRYCDESRNANNFLREQAIQANNTLANANNSINALTTQHERGVSEMLSQNRDMYNTAVSNFNQLHNQGTIANLKLDNINGSLEKYNESHLNDIRSVNENLNQNCNSLISNQQLAQQSLEILQVKGDQTKDQLTNIETFVKSNSVLQDTKINNVSNQITQAHLFNVQGFSGLFEKSTVANVKLDFLKDDIKNLTIQTQQLLMNQQRWQEIKEENRLKSDQREFEKQQQLRDLQLKKLENEMKASNDQKDEEVRKFQAEMMNKKIQRENNLYFMIVSLTFIALFIAFIFKLFFK